MFVGVKSWFLVLTIHVVLSYLIILSFIFIQLFVEIVQIYIFLYLTCFRLFYILLLHQLRVHWLLKTLKFLLKSSLFILKLLFFNRIIGQVFYYRIVHLILHHVTSIVTHLVRLNNGLLRLAILAHNRRIFVNFLVYHRDVATIWDHRVAHLQLFLICLLIDLFDRNRCLNCWAFNQSFIWFHVTIHHALKLLRRTYGGWILIFVMLLHDPHLISGYGTLAVDPFP